VRERGGKRAGWYPDPDEPGQMRWWDGHEWSAQAAAVGPEQDATPDSYAVASLVLAFLVIPVVPIWFGMRAKTRIRESNGTRDGIGIANLGIVLGAVEAAAIAAIAIWLAP
jgi:hypothetical protein